MSLEQTENLVNQLLQNTVKLAPIRGKKIICVDLTNIAYYGKAESNLKEIRLGQRKSGTNQFHAYATMYLKAKKQRYTLAVIYVLAGETMKSVVDRLYNILLRNYPRLQPDLWLLDRGFYNSATIAWFREHGFAFIMPACKLGRKTDDPKGASSTNRYTSWKYSAWDRYMMTSHTKHATSVGFDVAVFYHQGKDTVFIYACLYTRNLTIQQINQLYRSRFSIESTYRQAYQALVHTASRSPVLRLVFFALAMILRNVWVLLHLDYTLQKYHISFQLLLDGIAEILDLVFPLKFPFIISNKPKFNVLHA